MKILLSLPPNLVDCFHNITGYSRDEYFCTCDPRGQRLGSGGGTAWLLQQNYLKEELRVNFKSWLSREKRILVHAGGQSKRLPSYAVQGKVLMPVPVFRWERGQRLDQTLLDLQLPLYRQLMAKAPDTIHTMVVSGDVLIRTTQPLQPVPQADVVCYGLWLPASTAKNHGVFVSSRQTPTALKQMLQKPSIQTLNELQRDHYYLTDIGVWMLSDRAVELLMKKTHPQPLPVGRGGDSSTSGDSIQQSNGTPPYREGLGVGLEGLMRPYDLYSEFGCSLGTNPTIDDEELRQLTVAIVPLQGGEFYHFGTSREMISSTLAVQNLVSDQRAIMHLDRKPHPSIFVQNSVVGVKFTEENTNIWIENSYVPEDWQLSHDHVITGVPDLRHYCDPQTASQLQALTLKPGECIDVVPVGEKGFEVRRYSIDEPVNSNALAERANLQRLFDQRRAYRRQNWPVMACNWQHSVFYQLDLNHAAHEFQREQIPLPPPLPEDAPLMTRIHDAMFRGDSDKAFELLREGLTEKKKTHPQPLPAGRGGDTSTNKNTEKQSNYSPPYREGLGVGLQGLPSDQIVWARSPVRIDIAGGWTDTPPYCLLEGGTVLNLAIELNGQPPLQVYVKPCQEPHIILRSIDLGATETVETNDQLAAYNKVGSPFSIPKAALILAGFGLSRPLRQQLEEFGCGMELTLLSAIPAGSGLGTSSILAATVLGALNDFCSLGWDKSEIGHQTLMLEQMLTTGGGWQDQFGGVLGGVKLLQTHSGFDQTPQVRWLPDGLYTQPEYAACHLLYYTGITRTAKKILAEIVRRMFLNDHEQLQLLRQMKEHTMMMYDAQQRQDFRQMGLLLRQNWQFNQLLDSGTNPAEVKALTDLIDDLCLGYKLPGAGGGGYLYMVAKDPDAAARIKLILSEHRRNKNARFVDMSLSRQGMQISRS